MKYIFLKDYFYFTLCLLTIGGVYFKGVVMRWSRLRCGRVPPGNRPIKIIGAVLNIATRVIWSFKVTDMTGTIDCYKNGKEQNIDVKLSLCFTCTSIKYCISTPSHHTPSPWVTQNPKSTTFNIL